MSKIIVKGGNSLHGTVKVDGAKNAALPILAGSLLANGKSIIEDIPDLEDVRVMCEVLQSLGVDLEYGNGKAVVKSDNVSGIEAPYELVRKMRASFLVTGPLLAKLGKARISLPGGCAIGSRPIDLHLKGFSALGAEIFMGHGYIEAAAKRLKGDRIYLDYPSVGATENIMMAAVLAEGQTFIENAAEEPEIVDLANYLNAMGARIKGAGTDLIKIEGVKELKGVRHQVIPDRIEAGTYMAAAAITRGDVLINNVLCDHLKSIVAKLKETGAYIEELPKGIRVKMNTRAKAVDVKTLPYPGFPTDMQAQMMALLSTAVGTSVIIETVFENRFMHVDELKRMGAKIKIEGRSAIIEGTESLSGAPVKATDLRAGAALVLAGLAAEGETQVNNAYHLDRGYANIVAKLRGLGAEIYRDTDN
ncbi:UDP-N-acetylglucosamine 1-carboxyvinyltransferase 1 [Koleobacter methoxysyntrophicus]|uniref:UDP-N-acetylglucosamine 1-carboxyvinyltransferase n=1 Tax=Koleobacter methoxysyntrophicus TaxID=2751313 RepID=A0A8A0RMQ9_9FIRM|nr:UDP-N-acetylglucosamine 1-carboxyvinyltransferase [Koleobacter methoxysyntrophicus]QSQ09094.1 UDP-N-acetylglucosamine 1-carboxyvinyltransferase 1 [Koleobacter methoxysyntrophicus]